jgi:hypothetical protein
VRCCRELLSSVNCTGMGRKKSTVLADKYFEEERIESAGSGTGFTTRFTCKCCHSEPFLGLNGTKKVAHLLGVPGAGVQRCQQSKIKISKDEFESMADSTKSAREWKLRGAGGSHPLLATPPGICVGQDLYWVSVCVCCVGSAPRSGASLSDVPSRTVQIGLGDSFQSAKRLKLDRDLSKALLYQGNCSHGMLTENMHWKSVIQQLAKDAGLGAYVPPNRYRISNELLDYHYAEVKGIVEKRFLVSEHLAAPDALVPRCLTASFDGWDNASKTHVLGVMAISRSGAVFHKAIDTTSVPLMGTEWTLLQIRQIVDDLGGPENVAAVVLDSPNVNVGALAAYEKEQPTVACLLCTCHVISLFFKDAFLKILCIKEKSDIVNQISKKFRAVKWMKEMLHHLQTTLPLKVRGIQVELIVRFS